MLVAGMLYYAFRVMKASRTQSIFYGLLTFVACWVVVSQLLDMKMLGGILDQLVSVGALALIILFQDDIRQFLYRLGSRRQWGALSRILGKQKDGQAMTHKALLPIVMACINLSKGKVGALIVMERTSSLQDIVSTGDVIDANINQRLIENIFFKNSPLHDGAMVISGGRILAAGCILPVSHDLGIPKELGLRHRAAMGISEQTDALAIIVSEETGRISVAHRGSFRINLGAEELENIITSD